MQNDKKIELDEYWAEALRLLMESQTSFFLTWNWWTWKTFLINYFLWENKKRSKKQQKKVQMLATTWAAATLYDFWSTYHSFFRIFWETLWKVDSDQKKIMAHFDTYIIDEASMISASQFDLIDKRLRQVTKNYDTLFWGKQVIFVWHLFQASPVVTEATKNQYYELNHERYDDVYKSIFFFDAKWYDPEFFKIIELKKTHRTTDIQLQTYLKYLMLWENLDSVCKYFNKNYKEPHEVNYEKAVYIANTNSKVDKYNAKKLQDLKDSWAVIYTSTAKHWNWDVDWYWRITKEPSPLEIRYCIWARIMFNKNKENFKNGTMWTIVWITTVFDDFKNSDIEAVEVLIDWEREKTIVPIETWQKFEAKLTWNKDEDWEDEVVHEIIWSYIQYPFQLGWWITAHKSQWKTFDNIICDIWCISYKDDFTWEWVKKAVEHIVYVALSRATSYEWIQLVQHLTPKAIAVNKDVKEVTQKLIK